MKKSDKRLENTIRKTLTQVCEAALVQVPGFQWLTHLVNFSDFPQSLKVVCVFATDADLALAIVNKQDDYLRQLVVEQLTAAGIKLPDAGRGVHFDSEQACAREHDGRWQVRLKQSNLSGLH